MLLTFHPTLSVVQVHFLLVTYILCNKSRNNDIPRVDRYLLGILLETIVSPY